MRGFFSGGGEMGARMRAHDWTRTPLGAPEHWPQSLRTAVRILLTTQHPMFIWWGPELIQFYNDAYRQTMGPERHPSALGQRGRDCWGEIWDTIGPQIEFVMSGRGATWHEDQLVPVTRHGRREDVWWTYSFSPIDDETAPNGIGGVLVVCNDVTDRHRAFEALERSEERLQLGLAAGMVGTWDWHIDADRLIADDRFAQLFGVDAAKAAAGAPITYYLPRLHREDRARIERRLRHSIATGEEFLEEYRLVHDDGTVHWVSARGRCLYVEGRPFRFPGAIIDVTRTKDAERHREMLAAELSHRVKNIYATVRAIANQTFTQESSLEDARQAFSARLVALSRAHDILTDGAWAGTELGAVIANAVEHHAGGSKRIHLSGPDVTIAARPALTLTLTLHELATNAAKYGALSVPEGRVHIVWRIEPGPDSASLHLSWVESGGPPVKPPQHRGFGTRLIDGALAFEMGGRASVDFSPTGVAWSIVTSMESLVDDHAPISVEPESKATERPPRAPVARFRRPLVAGEHGVGQVLGVAKAGDDDVQEVQADQDRNRVDSAWAERSMKSSTQAPRRRG